MISQTVPFRHSTCKQGLQVRDAGLRLAFSFSSEGTEGQASRRKTVTMQEWADRLDAFLSFNERDVLTRAGKLRADVTERLALERYKTFDVARPEAAWLTPDAEDVAALEHVERKLADKWQGSVR